MQQTNTSQTPTAEAKILLIGNKDLQSQAFCAAIQKSLRIQCRQYNQTEAWKMLSAYNIFVLIDVGYICRGPLADLVAKLQQYSPSLRVALLNALPFSQEEALAEWPVVKGIFYRCETKGNLEKGLRALLENKNWLSRRVSDRLLNHHRKIPATARSEANLTRREFQVLCEIGRGSSNRDIANSLFVSEHTIKNHLSNIFRKIGVHNRLNAAQWANQNI